MDNTGDGPLRVPGLGDIPLDEELPVSERFAHGFCEWAQVPTITQREFTMVAAMNDITDKPDWHTKVFRQDAVDYWHDEAFAARPLMSEKAWEWCVAELRDKAAYYTENGFIHVLDTGSRICKSDTLVSRTLCDDIRGALHQETEEEMEKDGIVSLIDPSLYPLVWGRSLVVADDGDCCTVTRAPAHEDKRDGVSKVQEGIKTALQKGHAWPWSYAFRQDDYEKRTAYLWSYQHQWLPTEFVFTESEGTAMRLTSYINGIDPNNTTLDKPLAEFVSLCIAPWNDCLMEGRARCNGKWVRLDDRGVGWAPPNNTWPQRGRTPCRIITYGPQWDNEAPEWIAVFDRQRRRRIARYLALKDEVERVKLDKPPKTADDKTKKKHRVRLAAAQWAIDQHTDTEVIGLEQLPEPTPEQWIMAEEYLQRPEPGSDGSTPVVLPEDWKKYAGSMLAKKATRQIQLVHPEPATAFSYEEWKSGTHGGKAIVDMATHRPIRFDLPPIPTPHEPYTVCLQDKFRSQGLQIITRVDSITLDTEHGKAVFAGRGWSLAGQKNEHIVAIAMLPYEVDNITDVRISFRQQTEITTSGYNYNQHDLYQDHKTWNYYKRPAHTWFKSGHSAMCDVFGFDEAGSFGYASEELEMQEIGSVSLTKGRLITFPNTMEHRMESFRLRDESKKTGHVRWITLMLVDPHYRICSTRNVPPQQEDFSKEEAESVKKEMEEQQALATFARYKLTPRYFFD